MIFHALFFALPTVLLAQFLFLDFYRAKAYQTIRSMEHRRINLMCAKESFQKFLQHCSDYRLLHESEARKADNAPMSADDKRTAKIEKYKREKAAKQRIQELTRFLAITKGDAAADTEEEQRELYVLMLQSYARECVDELDLLAEEMKMLRMREEQLAQEELREGREGPRPSQPQPVPGIVPLDPNRPGISITKTYKVGDQLVMSRDTVKVFGTHIAAPTISLEEFGDQQLAEAQERAQREAEAPTGPRKSRQLLADGEEDDIALADVATVEDRRWDDWKDSNPKGWGNKMGKRY